MKVRISCSEVMQHEFSFVADVPFERNKRKLRRYIKTHLGGLLDNAEYERAKGDDSEDFSTEANCLRDVDRLPFEVEVLCEGGEAPSCRGKKLPK